MSVKNPDFERKHPRNPPDGRFTERVGGHGWAQRISDAVGGGRTRAPAVDPAVQQRREDVLDALNPEATHRREYTKLLTQMGYDEDTIQRVVDSHLHARGGLSVPVSDADLDQFLQDNFVDVGDFDDMQEFDDLLTNVDDAPTRFPVTVRKLFDYFDQADDPNYEGY